MTLTIEILNKKAYKLIHELEELHLIKLIKGASTSEKKLSSKISGKLSKKTAKKLVDYIKNSRSEWERDI